MIKPILFSTTMVLALMEDRKTQTRRIIKPQPIDNTEVDGNFFTGNHSGFVKVDGHINWRQQFTDEYSPYQPGDILWVRESWCRFGNEYCFKIKNQQGDVKPLKWKPSIHMPKAACRLFLEVTEAKLERLQEISEDDAMSEGIEKYGLGYKSYEIIHSGPHKGTPHPHSAISNRKASFSFKELWESINGPDSWNINPWVWTISFKRTDKPEGFIQ